MFERQTLLLLGLLVGAWLLQIFLSTQQLRRFHKEASRLRKQGVQSSIGLAGTTYRKKTYVVLVIDESDLVVAAAKLSGWTVFAKLKPVPQMAGIHLDQIGVGAPPSGLEAKTWEAFDHAAGFIRRKRSSEAGSEESAHPEVQREEVDDRSDR